MGDASTTHVVVVGSGFGGSVAACRLAQAGCRVTVLERGRSWPPGSFPRDLDDRWFWSRGHGLFDVRPDGDLSVVLAAGVGGGSLLYSNVHLRMPADAFADWPAGWSREELDPYYDLVAHMLDIEPIREDQPWGVPVRTTQFEEAVRTTGRQARGFRPPLAVNFGDPTRQRPNRFGKRQAGCRHCGKCSIGCNHAAKNTLDLTYLARAQQRGATVRPLCEAVELSARDGGGYRVVVDRHPEDDDGGTERETIDCDLLVLAAGALGTTELLLENAERLGAEDGLSPRLGQRYSANGDLVSVALFTDAPFRPTRGPAITTAYLDGPDPEAGGRWFLVQDGGVPPFVAWRGLLQGLLHPTVLDDWLRELPFLPDESDPAMPEEPAALIERFLSTPTIDNVAIFLAMGPDSADGVIHADGDAVDIAWPVAANEALYRAQEEVMTSLAGRLGARSLADLRTVLGLPRRVVSVHSLGGAVMGETREQGVVDVDGRVHGTAGVYVVDGAAIPTSTGVNPSHTIAAVAERNVERLVRRLRAESDWEAPERSQAEEFHDPLPWPAAPGGDVPGPDPTKRRSLLLAGGGMKVAAQAGVLQVLLDEAGYRFDHVDACSGGAFNLAMMCQGRSGLGIADTWRQTRPLDGTSLVRDVLRLPWGRSLLTLDAYRQRIFPQWGLDWKAVRESPLDATFTVRNVTDQRREVFTPAQMSEDALVACLSQAVWFPPVTIDGKTYTDAVFDTDANVEAALQREPDEIWVIWTVSRRGDWMPGPIAQFFHALEEAANGRFEADRRLIEWSNAEVRAGRWGLYGKPIDLKVIEIEVPVHYLLLAGSDRLHRMVELGVRAARTWCDAHGIPRPKTHDSEHLYTNGVSLDFPDHLRGRLGNRPFDADLRLVVPDAGVFVTTGVQRAQLDGTVTSPLLGGTVDVDDGYADVLVDQPVDQPSPGGVDPTRKRMDYVIHLGGEDDPRTLLGSKTVDSHDLLWLLEEVTTMGVRLVEGRFEAGDAVPESAVIAIGTLRMRSFDVLRQLFPHVRGGTLRERAGSVARFGGMFVGHLWDAYLRKVLTYSPF